VVASGPSAVPPSWQAWVLTLLIVVSVVGVVLIQGLRTEALPLPTNPAQGCQSLNGTSGSRNFGLYPGRVGSSTCMTFEFDGWATFNWAGSGKPVSFSVTFGPVVNSGWTGACPLYIQSIYLGFGLTGSGAFNESGRPHSLTCQGYAMGWSDSAYRSSWVNASFVSVSLSWGPR